MKKLALVALLVTSAFAGPVSHFGMLKVCGNNICGEITGTSTPVFFKGPSLFWSSGLGSSFYSPVIVNWFVDNMQIGIIRAAMGIQYYRENAEPLNATGTTPGYYYDPVAQKNLIKNVIDAAILNDIYVVVDWHSHNAHSETSLAKTFFTEMANEYKNVPNIIWEVYNEPISANVGQVTTYANEIITALRNAGNNNLVLVGSPSYSKQPKEQASDFGNSAASKNVAFTFHFYSDNAHKLSGGIGTSAKGAMTDGYAVFGSEWGLSTSDGGGNMIPDNTDEWIEWMDNSKVSNCMWSASAIDQSSAMFSPGTGPSNISTSRLTSSGEYFQTYMGKNKWTSQIPANHPKGKDAIASVKDGESVTLNSQLDLSGDITEIGEVPFGEASISEDKKSITYKTSDRGSESDKVQFIYKVNKGSITIQSKIVVNITDRRPVLPEKTPIAVSRRATKYLRMAADLSASEPSGSRIEIKDVSLDPLSVGTVSIVGRWQDSILFTPDASLRDIELTQATLNYTVQNTSNNLSNSASVVLNIQNIAPGIRSMNTTASSGNVPNTKSQIEIGAATLSGKNANSEPPYVHFGGTDADGDDLSFEAIYLDPQYPGSLEKLQDDTYIYHPESGRTGTVVLLAVITDGYSNSSVGRLNLNLTGDGTPINVAAPTEIPGISPVIPRLASSGALGLRSLGFGMVELSFAQSGPAKLDIYSLSGKNMGTLLNGWQNAGSSEVSLKELNLQKGMYILRLRQGSQVKTMRVVN